MHNTTPALSTNVSVRCGCPSPVSRNVSLYHEGSVKYQCVPNSIHTTEKNTKLSAHKTFACR